MKTQSLHSKGGKVFMGSCQVAALKGLSDFGNESKEVESRPVMYDGMDLQTAMLWVTTQIQLPWSPKKW
jgi:hypothetical protein